MFHQLLCQGIVPLVLLVVATGWQIESMAAEEARLLRQPTISDSQIAFAYGADLWIVERSGGQARRLTSTAAVESSPHFSPDGDFIAFTSNRSGTDAVYVVPVEGGTPKRLTWYPAAAVARGWSPDGAQNPLFFLTGHRPRGLRTPLVRLAGRGTIPALAGTLRQRWRLLTERPAARHRFGGPLGCRMATLPWWAKQTPADSRPRHARGDSVAS